VGRRGDESHDKEFEELSLVAGHQILRNELPAVETPRGIARAIVY
jgi:hypothetical protein